LTGIHAIDLKNFVTNSVKRVFGTMLSMEVESEEPPNRASVTTGRHVVGTVAFAGAAMGNVNIFVSRDFAAAMTAAMLGLAVEDIGRDEDVHDVIGEVCNMVGGDLKSRLCDAGFGCSLSIPSISYGDAFKVESKSWDRHEQHGFCHRHHSVLLEVYIKSAN
jgi:CheY-specific phosphatase CheX